MTISTFFYFHQGEENTIGGNSRLLLANDWMGYLPDQEAHALGGYQTWMGLHSYAEESTGERMVDESIRMLRQLAE